MEWKEWKHDKEMTLVFAFKDGKVLLGMKKRGFGKGKWAGLGGKVMEGEEIEEAARREFMEECGAEPEKLEKTGELFFDIDGKKLLVHVFVSGINGEPEETEEMRPEWFPLSDLPYDKMWEDNKMWIPLLLKGEVFRFYARFDGEKMAEHEIMEV